MTCEEKLKLVVKELAKGCRGFAVSIITEHGQPVCSWEGTHEQVCLMSKALDAGVNKVLFGASSMNITEDGEA